MRLDILGGHPQPGIDQTYIAPRTARAEALCFQQADPSAILCGLKRSRQARVPAANDKQVRLDVVCKLGGRGCFAAGMVPETGGKRGGQTWSPGSSGGWQEGHDRPRFRNVFPCLQRWRSVDATAVHDARLALTALLVRIARADNDYAQAERDRIDRLVTQGETAVASR